MAETEIIPVEQETAPTDEIQMEPQIMVPQALTMWNDPRLMKNAAAFFARSECPEVLMGCYTAEEIQDVKGYEAEQKTTVKFTLPSECKPCEAPDGDGK